MIAYETNGTAVMITNNKLTSGVVLESLPINVKEVKSTSGSVRFNCSAKNAGDVLHKHDITNEIKQIAMITKNMTIMRRCVIYIPEVGNLQRDTYR